MLAEIFIIRLEAAARVLKIEELSSNNARFMPFIKKSLPVHVKDGTGQRKEATHNASEP